MAEQSDKQAQQAEEKSTQDNQHRFGIKVMHGGEICL
jgi:hypothetical protein